jgi:PAS domain S-box-containing protein
LNDEERLQKVAKLLASLTSGDLENLPSLALELSSEDGGSGTVGKLTDAAIELAAQAIASKDVLRTLSEGRLSTDVPPGMPSLGAHKQLQANLRHLLWHLDRIAAGDYSQRTEFLGDFTATFDTLASSLQQKKELEERLRASEVMFRTLVMASPDEIAMTDLQGNLTFVSEAGLKMFDIAHRDEILGHNLLEYIAPEYREAAARNTAAMLERPQGVGEYLAVHPSGRRIWIEVNGEVLRDPEGRPKSLLFNVRDITWRKGMEIELKQSEERYRTLVETATIPIFILKADTTIQYMNDLGAELLGVKDQRDGSVQFLDFLDDSAWMDFAEVSLDSSDGSVKDGEILLRDRNDKRIWAYMSARRIELNGSPATFVSCNDITERKRTEEQLALANRKLTLLGSVTRHDVLNHLTALTGYLELAAMRGPDDGVKKFIEKAKQAAVAIHKQMELTRTYQELGTRDAEWIEVRSATEDELAGMDLGKVKTLVDLPEVEVLGDPLFMSCIHNIVHNSIKHGGKVQQVRISGYEDPTGFIIAIDDDGRGISSTQKQAIFDWNYNGRSGHGLNFVREVLNSTGMRVRETGTEGRGAHFEIVVPHRYYRMKK